MNIPTLASAKFATVLKLWEEWLKDEFPALPNVRSYVLPDEGEVLVSYDFASQELRVLAHYEDDLLLQAYREDPTQDLHQFAADTISKVLGIPFKRKQAKTCAFAILYGSGLSTLAAQLGSSKDEAGIIKNAYLEVLPGVAKLIAQLKSRARNNSPLRTWGGRVYYVEPPRFKDGQWRTFDYKLLNYLIQGSSADITKTAIIEYNRRKVHGRFLLTVHDQIVVSVPEKYLNSESTILKQCMESVPLDAQLLADGSKGPNLHNVEDFEL
jgi:DNA polymerase-1